MWTLTARREPTRIIDLRARRSSIAAYASATSTARGPRKMAALMLAPLVRAIEAPGQPDQGVQVVPGTGSWAATQDRTDKTRAEPVSGTGTATPPTDF
jgi:hypothetical protein